MARRPDAYVQGRKKDLAKKSEQARREGPLGGGTMSREASRDGSRERIRSHHLTRYEVANGEARAVYESAQSVVNHMFSRGAGGPLHYIPDAGIPFAEARYHLPSHPNLTTAADLEPHAQIPENQNPAGRLEGDISIILAEGQLRQIEEFYDAKND